MSAKTTVGPEANMLEPSPDCARQITLDSPILTNEQLEQLRYLGESDGPWAKNGFKTVTLSMVYRLNEGGEGLASSDR